MRDRPNEKQASGILKSYLLVLLLGVSAAACSFDIEKARNLSTEGEGFDQSLAREYREIALYEADKMYDWPDAALFSKKAILASSGQIPDPENIDDWNVPENTIVEFSEARSMLADSLGDGFGDDQPVLAAAAQASFDCWVEQQEEGWQVEHIAKCKQEFFQAMENWTERSESAGTPDSQAIPPVFVAEIVPEPIKEERSDDNCQSADNAPRSPVYEFLIRFQHNSAELDPAADDSLIEIAFHARGTEVADVFIEGHADLSGTDDYNLDLSLDRTLAVWQRMISLGTPLGKLWVGPRGETQPLSNAVDGVANSRDRRVLVTFFENSTSELVGNDACNNQQTASSNFAGVSTPPVGATE